MDIRTMHYDFKLKIDKVDSLTKEDFNVAEIDWLINEAQLVFVKQRYGKNNPHRTRFEETQKRTDDLSSLHVKYPEQVGIVPSVSDANVYEVRLTDLTQPYLFLTRGWVLADTEQCSDVKIRLHQIQNDDLGTAGLMGTTLNDPFNKSSALDGILFNFGKTSDAVAESSVYLYSDDILIKEVFLEYLKMPRRVFYGGYVYIDGTTPAQTDSEFPEHAHNEIIDIAVEIASGIIENPSYVQLKSQKTFKQE